MKKRWMLLIVAMFMMLVMMPAMAEEAIEVRFNIYTGAGEIVQPEYPDLSSQIGEGLTQDDFDITYATDRAGSYYMTVDESTGRLNMSEELQFPRWMNVLITYTPKVEGKGVKTVFNCKVYAGQKLTSLELSSTERVLGLDQESSVEIKVNDSKVIDHLVVDYDESIVQVEVRYRGEYVTTQKMNIIPKAIGETTITVRGYNGISASVHVKVLAPVTELTFAQDVYECYEGEAISLGIRLGEGDVERAANFADARVNGDRVTAGMESKYFLGTDGIMGLFCVDTSGSYSISATSYNGYFDDATVKVYDKESVVQLKSTVETIRMGDDNVKIRAYDAQGKQLFIKKFEVTKGTDIAYMRGEKLITTGVGEVEVTVYNYDGTTCSQTFTVEVMPTQILHNGDNLVMDIGETFDIEVWFDQGELPYSIGCLDSGVTEQHMAIIGLDGNRITAQAPGKTRVFIVAGSLMTEFDVTVRDGDKAVSVAVPEEPLHVDQSYQFYVQDKTGKIYPATFSIPYYCPYAEITNGGYLTALQAGSVSLSVQLEDGRTMRVEGIKIVQYPKWLQHDAVVMRKSQRLSVGAISDVGVILNSELSFEVANEDILTIDSSGVIVPKRTGTTKVTITSKQSGVSTTFTVQVISDASTLYIGTTTMYVADGYQMYMPTVHYANGREATVDWVITHDNPGEGNPNKSGFTVKGNVISCHWPTASCEVTGTLKSSNEKVKVTVYGYRLPETIVLEPEQLWLKVGERKTLNVSTPEEGTKIVYTFWLSEPAGIVTMDEVKYGKANTITGETEGVALVAAMLENEAMAVSLVTVYDPAKRLPGDANGDSLVNVYDPLLVMQYAAGWSVAINGQQGDVNADGRTDLQDAILIFQHDSGLDVELRQYIPAP